jgi:hypothetical protein
LDPRGAISKFLLIEQLLHKIKAKRRREILQ